MERDLILGAHFPTGAVRIKIELVGIKCGRVGSDGFTRNLLAAFGIGAVYNGIIGTARLIGSGDNVLLNRLTGGMLMQGRRGIIPCGLDLRCFKSRLNLLLGKT